MAIIDCFMFFNEFDLLEIRLSSLCDVVDRFVLVESPVTFSGNQKPLFFDQNKHDSRFTKFDILHLVSTPVIGWSRAAEAFQRNYLMAGLNDVSPDDIVLISDIDEIPNLESYRFGDEGPFKQKMFYYYLNVRLGPKSWKGTIAVKKKNIRTFQDLRDIRNKRVPVCRDGGWHFSTNGSVEQITYKIESFAERRFDTKEIKDALPKRRAMLKDPYNRRKKRLFVEMPTGPKWLLDNQDRYPHLFYRETP